MILTQTTLLSTLNKTAGAKEIGVFKGESTPPAMQTCMHTCIHAHCNEGLLCSLHLWLWKEHTCNNKSTLNFGNIARLLKSMPFYTSALTGWIQWMHEQHLCMGECLGFQFSIHANRLEQTYTAGANSAAHLLVKRGRSSASSRVL